MHLLYDNIIYSLQRYGGISTYWYELSKRTLKDSEVDITFFESKNDYQNILRPLLDIPDVRLISRKRYKPSLERFLRIPVEVPYSINSVFHSSYFRLPYKSAKLKKVCTVHDFIHDKFYKGPRAFLHNVSKKRCILESDIIITVSENTKKDLLEYYPTISSNRVIPVYNGVSELFKPIEFSRHEGHPFLLYIGTRHKYKNFTYAIDLTAISKNFKLYIVGAPLTVTEQKTLNMKLGGRYKCFTGISAVDLNILYNKAFCLIYPSSYEGFGIPLLEAMASGCPFVALNKTSIPEVAGNAGFLLNDLSLDGGLHAIDEIRINYKRFQDAGLLRVKYFSWDKCYADTMNVYKQVS